MSGVYGCRKKSTNCETVGQSLAEMAIPGVVSVAYVSSAEDTIVVFLVWRGIENHSFSL